MKYLPRVVDEELRRRLSRTGAVLIEGPKWCGKTTTAKQVASSILYMQDPKGRAERMMAAEFAPQTLLEGDTPRLIDEWQLAAGQIWDTVRFECDLRQDPGQFILTGSATPVLDTKASHSGVGRIGRMRMRPMTLWEAGLSEGGYSLQDLFAGQAPSPVPNRAGLEDVLEFICRGGWPNAYRLDTQAALDVPRDYIDAIIETDIQDVDDVKRDPVRVRALLRALGRNVATEAPNTVILDDVNAKDSVNISMDSVTVYQRSLERMFVIEDLPAWNPALKSKTAIRTRPTRHFVDPSLAVASLDWGPADLLADLLSAGYYFENLCIRDLRVYAQALNGDVFHYRDKAGREADAVIHLRNGQWALVEIKLGGEAALRAADDLLTLRNDIRQDAMGAPAFLMVLTAVGTAAYRLENGVHIVPIACLQP